jgi:hypothetical protein
MNKKLLLYIIFGGLISLSLFQNCAGPTASVKTTDSESVSTYAEAPFAYDVQINQLTYMSCNISSNNFTGQNLNALDNRKAFFSYAVGAYNDSGLKLSSDFNTYAYQNLSTGKEIDPAKVKTALENSTLNQGVQLNLTVRSRTNPFDNSGILHEDSSKSTAVSLGMNAANLLSPLSATYITDVLKEALSTRFNYFSGGTVQEQRALEGNIAFLGVEAASQIRARLQNDFYLALTFQGEADQSGETTSVPTVEPRPGETPKVYGIGLGLNFASPNAKSPTNVVSAITEFDLANPGKQTGGIWSCPSRFRYKIISSKHAATSGVTACPAVSDATLAALDKANNTTLLNDRNILKRHLDVSYWRINPQLKCVVPNVDGGDCYSNTALINGQVPIEYPATTIDCGSGKSRDCAEYVSVCLRN